MTVSTGQVINALFTTRVFATGVGTNADSLPTGTLYLNGTANGATVTVTNISTGLYKAAVTMPTLTPRDVVFLIIAATVSSISDSAAVWGDTTDILLNRAGTAQAGASGTITLDSGASATNNLYINETIAIVGGTGSGQTNIITAYNGSTKVATVGSNWVTTPDNTSIFIITSTGPANVQGTVGSNITQWLGQGVSAATAGVPDVNVLNMNNVSASAITTVNANQGTTQPVKFTGTGASALVQADVTDWKAATAPAMTGDAFARLGAPAGASVSADIAAVEANALAAKNSTAGLTFTVSNKVDANVLDIAGQAASAAAGVTFPASIASPTNITAGTITTVTNLTNAPTAGDLTSTMKTSVTTACNAATTVGITSNRKKGASSVVEFLMQDATTGAPKTGLTVTSTITKDGGSSASTTNSVTEIGLGQYQLQLSSTEMTANNIFLQFTATGAITVNLWLQTQV